MKILIFDLALQLRYISDRANNQAALEEFGRSLCPAGTHLLNTNDWNIVRVSDEIADEIVEWQALGSPLSVSPLKDLADWRRWKTERL